MEGVERTNMVVVRKQEQKQRQGAGVPLRWDPYAIEVDQGRTCYACRGFRHMTCHCRNRGRERAIKERGVEYEGGRIEEIHKLSNNLKEMENIELLD